MNIPVAIATLNSDRYEAELRARFSETIHTQFVHIGSYWIERVVFLPLPYRSDEIMSNSDDGKS